MSAALVFQRWARGTLAADADLTALVTTANIFDSKARPEVSPRIVVGEDQEIPLGDLDQVESRYTRVFSRALPRPRRHRQVAAGRQFLTCTNAPARLHVRCGQHHSAVREQHNKRAGALAVWQPL
jgi:hypothetical protein